MPLHMTHETTNIGMDPHAVRSAFRADLENVFTSTYGTETFRAAQIAADIATHMTRASLATTRLHDQFAVRISVLMTFSNGHTTFTAVEVSDSVAAQLLRHVPLTVHANELIRRTAHECGPALALMFADKETLP